MKNWFFLLALFSGIWPGIAAQAPTPSVISPNGGVAQNSNMILEWTIGEIAVESYRDGDKFYTEGFHQPTLVVSPVEKPGMITPRTETENPANGLVRVMPNPVSSTLTVDFDLDEELDIILQVFDSRGQKMDVEKINIQKGHQMMDFSAYPSGMYILHVESTDGQFIRNCKITKI